MNQYYHENDYFMDEKGKDNVFAYIASETNAMQSAADDTYNVGEDCWTLEIHSRGI